MRSFSQYESSSRNWETRKNGMKLKWTVGWDPSEGGEVCAGPPTVTVFNLLH
jgi:hypothetical protein